MKKVGIIVRDEDTFPLGTNKINEMGEGKIVAEPVQIDKITTRYRLRIRSVFYRSYFAIVSLPCIS
jgi:hypothetical protein